MRRSPSDGGSGQPFPIREPSYWSLWFLLAHGAFVVALAITLMLLEWSVKGVAPWPGGAIMFALGAAIGLAGTPAMISLIQAGEPYRRLQAEFTRGRFFTLACPTLSPRYWRAARALRRTLADRGIASPSPLKAALAMSPIVLASGAGWAARSWLGTTEASPMFAFLGCIVTWLNLSALLYRRRLRGSAGRARWDSSLRSE